MNIILNILFESYCRVSLFEQILDKFKVTALGSSNISIDTFVYKHLCALKIIDVLDGNINSK